MKSYNILIKYSYNFFGEILQDSYKRNVLNQEEENDIYNALINDPLVFDVSVIRIENIINDEM